MHGGVGGGYEYIHGDREGTSSEPDIIGGLYIFFFWVLPFLVMAYQNLWGG